MSIVTMFFDQQKAGEINAIINNNFRNVSKYIPVSFDSLTTVERLNLGADWKEHGKLVFDIDQEQVYMWDEDVVDWVAYLIEARDSFARALATEVQQKSFTRVVLGEDCILRFYNALGDEVGNQLLTADKIQYDSADTVFSKIEKLVNKDAEQQEQIDDMNNLLGNTPLPTDAQTVTGAIKELYDESNDHEQRLSDIEDGTTKVPNAIHADEASDSDKLGGNTPDYYATQADMTNTQDRLDTLEPKVAKNTDDITDLKNKTTVLENTANGHTTQINSILTTISNIMDVLTENGIRIIDKDYIIEITESKETYSTTVDFYNPDFDSIRVFINGGYVYSGNYSLSYDTNTGVVSITNLNHSTSPWLKGYEITLLITTLTMSELPEIPDVPNPPTPTVESGVMYATVGELLDEQGGSEEPDTPTPEEPESVGYMKAKVGENLEE